MKKKGINKLRKKKKETVRIHCSDMLFDLKIMTSTLSDNWIDKAPLTDDPWKVLAFTTSK